MKKILAAAAALVLLSAPVAHAASAAIESAKANCVVGERIDGYLGVVSGATASDALRREVASINQRRKVVYSRLASEQGVTIDAAAAVTAESLINRAPSGHCVQNASGAWVKKP